MTEFDLKARALVGPHGRLEVHGDDEIMAR